MNSRTNAEGYPVSEYCDELHAEVPEDLMIGEHGYKHRILEGVVMPPYVTPARYRLSRTIRTRPGDVCYVSFPKSGSTWLSYIILLALGKGVSPEGRTLRNCLHWVESSWTYPRSREELDDLPSPRIFKSHMPYSMALGGEPVKTPCRYVYIARNPKDVAVSYYYFERGKSWSGNYNGPWEHWLGMFLEGRVQRGDWFSHVLGWWQHRDAPNILFLRYEDLVRNFRDGLRKIARFLEVSLTKQEEVMIEHKTAFQAMQGDRFSNMHEIPGFSGFFRRGRIGSWKEQFTAEQNETFDRICSERLAGSGLDFEFE